MTYKTPSGMKKHCESTEPESHQTAKKFSFLPFSFSSSSSDGRVHSFTIIWFLLKTAAFVLNSAPALCFSRLKRGFKLVNEELWLHLPCHFLHLHA